MSLIQCNTILGSAGAVIDVVVVVVVFVEAVSVVLLCD